MKNKWAVIGASSFSGKAFCNLLSSMGEDFTPMSRKDGFDLNDPKTAQARMIASAPDYVVNFAALNVVADSWKYYDDYYQTNVVGCSRLAAVCARLPSLKKFVQVSTPEVYGSTGIPLVESTDYHPSTPYAVSRAAFDMHLMAMHKATGFPVCFTRSVNVYGEGQQPYRIIPKTVLKILRGEKLKLDGGGVSRRAFIHIEDMARAIYTVALAGKAGDVYHAAYPALLPISELVEDICLSMGASYHEVVEEVEERRGKDMAYTLNDSKLRALGWGNRNHFEESLLKVVRWYVEHQSDYKNHSLEYEHKA